MWKLSAALGGFFFALILSACGGGANQTSAAIRQSRISSAFTGEVIGPAGVTSNMQYGNAQLQAQCSNVLGSYPPLTLYTHTPDIHQTFAVSGDWGWVTDAAYFNETSAWRPAFNTANGLSYSTSPYITDQGHQMYGWLLFSQATLDPAQPFSVSMDITPGQGFQGLAVGSSEADYREIGISGDHLVVFVECSIPDLGPVTPGRHTLGVQWDGAWHFSMDGTEVFTETTSGALLQPAHTVLVFDGIGSGTVHSVSVN